MKNPFDFTGYYRMLHIPTSRVYYGRRDCTSRREFNDHMANWNVSMPDKYAYAPVTPGVGDAPADANRYHNSTPR